MSKRNEIVIGIDVAKEFSYFFMEGPDGTPLGKPFKVNCDVQSLEKAAKKIKEEITKLRSECVLVMEDTGHYSSILFHFFYNENFNICKVNPLQTNSIKNISIRKVKSDKEDAKKLVQLYRTNKHNLRLFSPPKHEIASLGIIVRQLITITDNLTMYLNRLNSYVDQAFPGFDKTFNLDTLTSLYLLENYPTPGKFLTSKKDELVPIIASTSRKGTSWAAKKYDKLMEIAHSALKLSCSPSTADIVIKTEIQLIKAHKESIKELEAKMEELAENIEEVKLAQTVTGVGIKTGCVFITEIRDISNFKSPRKLLAFCGLDPAVNESGKFKGTRVSISKRGSKLIRKLLYTAAQTAISQRKGIYLNPVLAEYYQEKIKSKSRKSALMGVMHKIVNYIFAVLRDKKPFRVISKEEHIQNHLEANKSLELAA